MRAIRVPALCAVALFGTVALAAPQPADVDGLLALDPAPGVEALLLSHATDGRVGRRWIGLLTHADARIRLSAARAIGATNVKGASGALLEALARERDVALVGELLQAIAIVAPDADVLQVHAHLDRIGEARAAALLDGLAAARPDVIARHLVTAEPLRSRAEWVRAAYGRLVRTSPAGGDAVEATLLTSPEAPVLEGVLGGATDARRTLPPALVHAGLRLPLTGRLATITYLATLYGSPARVTAEAALRAARATGHMAPDDAPAAQWVRELERRWLGDDATTALTATIAALPAEPWLRGTPREVLAVLTADERASFVNHYRLPEPAARALMDVSPGEPSPDAPASSVTVLTDAPAIMIEDVIRATNCRPEAQDERFHTVRYRADRRPGALARDLRPWSPGCDRAAHAAIAMAYGAPPRVDTDRTLVLVRLDEEFVACLADRQAEAPTPAGSNVGVDASGVVPPRKIRDRPPAYPDEAVRSRLQGIVAIEARIERSGCVSEARVTQPVHPWLDAAALQAVSRWRYTPTSLNGDPVPVMMTVHVNFSLR